MGANDKLAATLHPGLQLTKTQSVLKAVEVAESVTFDNFELGLDPKDTDTRGWRTLVMTQELWFELGSPQEITVSVEPGNTLEEPHSSRVRGAMEFGRVPPAGDAE